MKVIIVGMGARVSIYAEESLKHPDLFSVVEALAAVPVFADAVINGTMDPQHVETTIPLLQKGYDVLLENPFAVDNQKTSLLLECARRTGRKVMVCHVLRCAPFYRKIWQCLKEGGN